MDQIGSLLKRPMRYGNIDGTGELGLGALGMGYFALLWLQGHSSQHSIWRSMWTLFVYVGMMCAALYFGTKAIKERITYPRTGFVSYRRAKAVWVFAIAFVLAAIVAGAVPLLLRMPAGRANLPLLVGSLAFVGLYAYRAAYTVPWKWVVAGAMALGAIAIAFLPAAALTSIAGSVIPDPLVIFAGAFLLLCLLWSALWLISGGISLSLYYHHMPRPDMGNK